MLRKTRNFLADCCEMWFLHHGAIYFAKSSALVHNVFFSWDSIGWFVVFGVVASSSLIALSPHASTVVSPWIIGPPYQSQPVSFRLTPTSFPFYKTGVPLYWNPDCLNTPGDNMITRINSKQLLRYTFWTKMSPSSLYSKHKCGTFPHVGNRNKKRTGLVNVWYLGWYVVIF